MGVMSYIEDRTSVFMFLEFIKRVEKNRRM